ncbi:MAG: T9SS type A sorting domain-containing protein [bacterium]|nr:T9SS type A sorting domain-containing protein [bacterium]
MRKFVLSLILLVSIVVFQLNTSDAGDRKILQERFTSSTCGPCATNNPTLDAFLLASDPNKITSLSYHMNWPSPGNDPMYLANTADNNTRRSQYNVNAIPNWFFDGVISMTGGSNSQLVNAYNQRTDLLSPVTIILNETRTGNTVNAKVEIYCETVLANPNAIVQFVVAERLVQYASPPGTNGERIFYDVMRKMLPSGIGTSVTLLPGKKITLEYTYAIDASWQASEVNSVVFVQSGLEILNSATLTTDFNLISLPAYRTVQAGQNQNENFKAHIPSIANGFNSSVTFTSEIIPATSGITVSFPNGNSINNFPDSLLVNVASNSSVPVGEYKVVLTGTSASGKVHKTSFTYLVGRNYIITGTNRNLCQYKVDNIAYSTSRVFTWDLNSTHTLEAISPQTFGNVRYVYTNWSNGGTQTQTVTIGTQESGYTANYKPQYRLLGVTEPTGIPATVNGSNSYLDSSSVNDITLSAVQVQFNGRTYYFNRWEGTGNGSYTGPNPVAQITMNMTLIQKAIFDTIDVGISNYSSLVPDQFALYQNYPNPFNPVTNIKFDIAKSSFTNIIIFDMLGKEVATLVNENLSPGSYQYNFDASNYPSGIYYYKIKTDSYTEIKKMMLIK